MEKFLSQQIGRSLDKTTATIKGTTYEFRIGELENEGKLYVIPNSGSSKDKPSAKFTIVGESTQNMKLLISGNENDTLNCEFILQCKFVEENSQLVIPVHLGQ